MLPWVCSAVEHGRRQNVVKTSVTHFVCGSCATYFVFSTDILMSSVIYYWTWRTATWNLFVKQTMGNCCIRLTSDNSNPRKLEPRANSNQSRFTLDFLLTFTVILPSVTRTLYISNLSLTRTNFCFPSAHFYTVLPSITKTMLQARDKSGKNRLLKSERLNLQPRKCFFLTFLSLQFKFSVHFCILCCLRWLDWIFWGDILS